MNFFESIIIGFVQGVGEFLPISSSGHLVIMYQLFNITGDTVLLSIFLHIATLFSVFYVYRAQIIKLIKNPLCKTNKLLLVATIPTVIIAIILKKFITSSFEGNFVIFGFLITAVVLGFADYYMENQPSFGGSEYYIKSKNQIICRNKALTTVTRDITDIGLNYKQVFLMGVAQGVACFPGISRSGSTIATGLFVKGNKGEVTTFSFLLSIPVIIGSLIFSIFDMSTSAMKIDTFNLISACLISFLVGIFSIGLIDRMVKKQKLSYFSFYLIGFVFLILIVKFVF